jgi:hypothetical protein
MTLGDVLSSLPLNYYKGVKIVRPITREDSFLEFQINRLIAELQEFRKLFEPKPEVQLEPVVEEQPVVVKGRKKRDTL